MPKAKRPVEKTETKVEEAPPTVGQAMIPTAAQMDIVVPSITPKAAGEAFKMYKDMCESILEPSDYQVIMRYTAGKGMVKKPFKVKSAWRKLATAYNISDEILKEERKEYKEARPPYFVVEVTVKVSARNGRFATGVGSCASNERQFAHLEHDVRSTAHTRAKNRAISDLIGTGEVSAEEMEGTCDVDHSTLPVATSQKPTSAGRKYVRCPKCNYWRWVDSKPQDATEEAPGEPQQEAAVEDSVKEKDPTDAF